MANSARKSKAKSVSPFTVVKSVSKKASKSGLKEVNVPKSLVASIDDYARIHAEIKSLEAEKDQCKNDVSSFGKESFAKRLFKGITGNFKLEGDDSVLSFLTIAKSKNMGQEQYEEFEEKWGTEVAESCLKKDIGTVKFDADVYEANEDVINKALTALGEKIGAPLFVGMAYKVPKNILDKVADKVDSSDDLEELIEELQITTQIRVSK